MGCGIKNSLTKELADKLNIKEGVVVVQLSTFMEQSGIEGTDLEIGKAFIDYLYNSKEHKHLNIRELSKDNSTITLNTESNLQTQLEDIVIKTKQEPNKIVLGLDSFGSNDITEVKQILQELQDKLVIPDNIILPYELEVRPIARVSKQNVSNINSFKDTPIKEGVAAIFEQNSELSKIGSQQAYSKYLDTIFPDSKVKDIVYHGSANKFDKFDKILLGKNTGAESAKEGFFFSSNIGTTLQYIIYELEQIDPESSHELNGIAKRLSQVVDEYENNPSLENKEQVEEWSKSLDKTIKYWLPIVKKDVNIYRVLLNLQNSTEIDYLGKKKRGLSYAESIKKSKLENKDSTIFYNTYDPTPSNIFVAYEPEQIHILGSKEDIEGFKSFMNNNSKQSLSNVFSPTTLKDRKNLLINLFTTVVTQLNSASPNIERREFIKSYGVDKIFNNIKGYFQEAIDNEDNPQEIKDKLQLVVDNFSELVKLATPKINSNENITISEGEDNTDGEDVQAEAWTIENMEQSSLSSLSTLVRQALNRIPILDKQGNIDKDDLGFDRYHDSDHMHSELLTTLSKIYEANQMLPALEKMKVSKPWVKGVLDLIVPTAMDTEEVIKDKQKLRSLFYTNFRKDEAKFIIQKKQVAPDGSVTIKTINLNEPKGIMYLLNRWRDTIDSNTVLSKNSIYDKDGLFNKDNVKANITNLQEINKELKEITSSNIPLANKVELLNDYVDKNVNSIQDMLRAVGIDANEDEVANFSKYRPSENVLPYIEAIISALTSINSIVSKDNISSTVAYDKLKTLNTQYKTIADLIAPFVEEYTESSVHQGKKMRYSFLNPNYFGKMIKQLKNSTDESIEDYRAWMHKEFGAAEFFYKDGTYRNEWLRLLSLQDKNGRDLGAKYREMLSDMINIESDTKEYTDMDSPTFASTLIHNYLSDINKESAYYHVPVMADAPVMRFIKFVRYTTDKQGTFEDKIVDKFLVLAKQEIDDINLTIARESLDKLSKIKNQDTNGKKFNFLTYLNEYKDGIFQELDNIKSIANPEEQKARQSLFDNRLKTIIRENLDKQFAQAVEEWTKVGLFETNDKGILVNLDSKLFGTDINNLDRVKNTDPNTNSDNLLKEYFYNSTFAYSQILEILTGNIAAYKGIEDFQKRAKQWNAPGLKLDTTAEGGRTVEHTVYLKDQEIESPKELRDNTRKALEKAEASGKMTEISKLNILAKFGEYNATRFKVGDNVYTHTKSNDTTTQDYFNNGKKISEETYLNALAEYGKEPTNVLYAKDGKYFVESSLINVADAQAYRSESSYVAVLKMAGKYTPAVEQALANIKSGTFTVDDFTIALNSFKPFFFGNTMVNSGVTNNGNPVYIRQAVQNKNSEFLLLLQGLISKSPKLAALENFMSKEHDLHDGKGYIDVVQFNSAVKVGEQGVLDINDLNNKGEILAEFSKHLKNPDVVHSLSYSDYSLQQEVPEHYIDAEQLDGTQIRKLIHSDMPDKNPDGSDVLYKVKIAGKDLSLTKAQWKDWYNTAITENLIQSWNELQKKFNNNVELERILKEEITGRKAYSQDLLDAVTLDENGEFKIPLFELSQSIQFQNLLNSVIKSNITKQKTKGGSLVQVSAYGLSDDLKIVFNEDGGIKHFECFMPWYSRKYLEDLIIKDGPNKGTLDITKLPEDLRELVGYRIPTEDKYSMVPLYIKGFLPQQSGGAIMLPAEITTIAGSD